MNATRHVFSVVLLLAVSLSLPLRAEGLNERLAFLKPLLGPTWHGEYALADGSDRAVPITVTYQSLWDGKVIHYTRSLPDFPYFSEGYIYWDDDEQKVSLWGIDSRGKADGGVVTFEDGKITVRSQATINGRIAHYRNTFEVGADGKLTDRWFQNETGSWQPGHVIVFARGK